MVVATRTSGCLCGEDGQETSTIGPSPSHRNETCLGNLNGPAEGVRIDCWNLSWSMLRGLIWSPTYCHAAVSWATAPRQAIPSCQHHAMHQHSQYAYRTPTSAQSPTLCHAIAQMTRPKPTLDRQSMRPNDGERDGYKSWRNDN
jgi:hypothetical protein